MKALMSDLTKRLLFGGAFEGLKEPVKDGTVLTFEGKTYKCVTVAFIQGETKEQFEKRVRELENENTLHT